MHSPTQFPVVLNPLPLPSSLSAAFSPPLFNQGRNNKNSKKMDFVQWLTLVLLLMGHGMDVYRQIGL
jgi:hypothetical protein